MNPPTIPKNPTVSTSSSKNRRLRRRLLRHFLPLFAFSGLFLALLTPLLPGDDLRWKLSMTTAYLGLAGLGATLLIGAYNILFARPNPTSTDLRRDIGIWAAVITLTHVVVGLFVHFRGQTWQYFLFPADIPHRLPFRYDPFGIANYLGLLATLALAVVLATSNDLSLRYFGKKRWKNLQRVNYFLFGLVVLHGVAYQLVEKRILNFVVLFGIVSLVVVVVQLAGFIKFRHEKSHQAGQEPG